MHSVLRLARQDSGPLRPLRQGACLIMRSPVCGFAHRVERSAVVRIGAGSFSLVSRERTESSIEIVAPHPLCRDSKHGVICHCWCWSCRWVRVTAVLPASFTCPSLPDSLPPLAFVLTGPPAPDAPVQGPSIPAGKRNSLVVFFDDILPVKISRGEVCSVFPSASSNVSDVPGSSKHSQPRFTGPRLPSVLY